MQINRQTYEEFFLLYADDELNETERKQVEEFIDNNPDLQGEFNLIRQTVMVPDESIIFAGKELLFKEEDDRKVVMVRWFRYAAAAVILISLSITGWLFLDNDKRVAQPVAVLKPQQKTEEPARNNNESTAEPIKSPENTSGTFPEKTDTDKRKEPTRQSARKTSADENITAVEAEPETAPDIIAPAEEPAITIAAPDPLDVNADVVLAEPVTEPIDVQVTPRQMLVADEPETPNVQYAAFDEEREKSDIIYFANTSLTKKTKLRGVLRKATRYIERVTSIQ